MKTMTANGPGTCTPYRTKGKKYPGAAETGYFVRRIVDLLLCTAIAMGAVAAVMLLITMG